VGEGKVNVCKAIEDMKTDARNEGLNAGREEGRSEGFNEGILMTVSMLKKMNLSKDAVIKQLTENYPLTGDKAAALVNSRW